MELVVAGALIVIGVLAWIVVRMKRHASRINHYFANALRVYAFLGEDAARVAALAAAKVAAGLQRQSMVWYLDCLRRDLEELPDEMSQTAASRLLRLQSQIVAKDWTLWDGAVEKRNLRNQNSEYLIALERADDQVFARRHPELFRG